MADLFHRTPALVQVGWEGVGGWAQNFVLSNGVLQ